MKFFKLWLFVASLVPLFTLFYDFLGLPDFAPQLAVSLLLSSPFIFFTLIKGIRLDLRKHLIVIYIGLALILFNILNSLSPVTSGLYWGGYLVFVYGVIASFKFFSSKDQLDELLTVLKKNGSICLGLSTTIVFVFVVFLEAGNEKTLNTLGILSAAAMVYFYFARDFSVILRYSLSVAMFVILLMSFSRSSLFIGLAAIGLMELFTVGRGWIRKVVILFSIFIAVIYFQQDFFSWLGEKENFRTVSSIRDILMANEDRSELIEHFATVYQDNFATGYGINTSYQEEPEWNQVENNSVHNGILDMVLQIGVPLSLLVFILYFRAQISAIKNFKSDFSILPMIAFLFYGLLRTYGESYFLFNTGNFMSILFIILNLYFYNYQYLARQVSDEGISRVTQ